MTNSNHCRFASIVAIGALALALAVTPVRSDEKMDARALAIQQSVIAAGRRSVTVVAEGVGLRDVDSAEVSITVSSNATTSELSRTRFEDFEPLLVDALKKANLPAPADHSDIRIGDPSVSPGFFRRVYRVPLKSYDGFEAVRTALRALEKDQNDVERAKTPRIESVGCSTKSSALDANRSAVKLEAQQSAFDDAKKRATQIAEGLGMKIGKPLAVSPIEISDYGFNSPQMGYSARGIVVFELVD